MSFSRTLQKGLERFNKAKGAAQGSTLSGRDAFELYDTFGFPPDLTQVRPCSVCHAKSTHCVNLIFCTAHVPQGRQAGTMQQASA